jgi:type IV secretory pathway VirB10-like protein
LAELSPIPTLPGEILKKPTPTLLHMPKIPYVSPEDLELEALRQAEGQRIARRERREQAEKQRKKEEQEERYQANLEKSKAIDEENNRRLEIALVLASKKQEEEEDDDEWSEESISRFCSGTKTIVIDDIPNTPRSEEIVQDLIQSLNTPA